MLGEGLEAGEGHSERLAGKAPGRWFELSPMWQSKWAMPRSIAETFTWRVHKSKGWRLGRAWLALGTERKPPWGETERGNVCRRVRDAAAPDDAARRPQEGTLFYSSTEGHMGVGAGFVQGSVLISSFYRCYLKITGSSWEGEHGLWNMQGGLYQS